MTPTVTERSYRQYCPIARALDLVGDRWALLVVRDLFLGPKRFTDLRDGLPGIGTNILTDRLKGLERAGVIRRRRLPPPAASTVYALTERGRALEGVMTGLAGWGGQTLGPRRSGEAISVESLLLAVSTAFGPLARRGFEDGIGLEVRVEEPSLVEPVVVAVDAAGVRVAGDEIAVVGTRVATDAETLYGLAAGRETVTAAIERGALRIDGTPAGRSLLLGCAADGVGPVAPADAVG